MQQRQLDSTKALSEHIGSDVHSIMCRLQGLTNSLHLQLGNLSSNQTAVPLVTQSLLITHNQETLARKISYYVKYYVKLSILI